MVIRSSLLPRTALLALVAILSPGIGLVVSAQPQECAPPAAGEPIQITDDCIDPRFSDPIISEPGLTDDPVPHYAIEGRFDGTDTEFQLACPLQEDYRGRIIEYTHPLLGSFLPVPAGSIPFALSTGACFLWTNQGGADQATSAGDTQEEGFDAAYGGYRVNAAAMQAAKAVATELYGEHEPLGYLYGGSGGAYQTVCSAEHTSGVWAGYVPFIMGTPHAIPSMFTVRINALRILRQRDRFPDILDAIDPGGSGDPYATLNQEEAEAYDEAIRMGFPPRGWWDHATLTGGPLALVADYVPLLDPTYFDDFYTQPGYLGFDDPYGTVATSRIQAQSSISETRPTLGFPGAFVLALPDTSVDLTGADLVVQSGAAAGQTIPLYGTLSDPTLPAGSVLVAAQFNADPAIVSLVAAGDEVTVDNSRYLALQTYHRHQVPESEEFVGWNQFRNDAGDPVYPQRDVLVGPIGAFNGAGCLASGEFRDPMILIGNLMDIDALPWQSDWYRDLVIAAQGRREASSRFRLFYIDHAQHNSPAPTNTAAFARTINYQGVLQHALRDLVDWVEEGVAPPRGTRYGVADSQIRVPVRVGRRKGLQPTVTLTADGGERAEVRVGEEVEFRVKIKAPQMAGRLVAVEWDFEGVGDFPVSSEVPQPKHLLVRRMRHAYARPGTYFAVVRATQQREGDGASDFARVQNLDRVRVVVTE